MADKLLETKLKEAVSHARGDAQAAVRLLIAWSEKDEALLRTLVQPFLQGILFHLVDRTIKQVGGDPVAPRAAAQPVEPAAPAAAAAAKPKAATSPAGEATASEPVAAKPAAAAAAKARPAGELPADFIDALVERWGANIPVATQPVPDHPPRTVEEVLQTLGRGEPPPPGKASGRHESGMRLIAKVQRMKRAKIG